MAAINLLGLDIGEQRIGVARVNTLAKLPEPLITLKNDNLFVDNLKKLIVEYQISYLIIGLPRNLSGEETPQTQYVKRFSQANLADIGVPIKFQDETLSSVAAEERMNPKNRDLGVDALAATVILEDYLRAL